MGIIRMEAEDPQSGTQGKNTHNRDHTHTHSHCFSGDIIIVKTDEDTGMEF